MPCTRPQEKGEVWSSTSSRSTFANLYILIASVVESLLHVGILRVHSTPSRLLLIMFKIGEPKARRPTR